MINLPTMAYHFFEPPNKVLITSDDFRIIIQAEINETFDREFSLDSKSFDLFKKLETNRKIIITDKRINISSDEGKYECSFLNKTKPNFKMNDILYKNTYSVQTLKNASEFVSNNKTRPVLCGVLLNNVGEVIGTDSQRIYYDNLSEKEYTRIWSIPIDFIRLLTGEKVEISFSDKEICCDLDAYKIYSVIYCDRVPDIKMVISQADKFSLTFMKTDQINLFESEICELNCDGEKLELKFKDNDNEFSVNYPTVSEKFNYLVTSNYFVKALNLFVNPEIKMRINDRFLRINDKIIISLRRGV